MSIFHSLKIKEVRRETEEAVSIAFQVPDHLKEEFRFVPGQYITLQQELDGSVLRRAYSICSSPSSEELRVSVKEVPKGRFSAFANRKLKAGDSMEVSGPEGRFILETVGANGSASNGVGVKARKYIAFAAGSGITPVISMIKAVLEQDNQDRFVLVYGNKSKDRTIFKKELDELKAAYPDRFSIFYVYSQILSDQALFGRIDKVLAKKVLNQCGIADFDNYFLCGPEEMIDAVTEFLVKDGVDKEKIKMELFSTTSHKKEINKDLDGNTELTVMLDEEETTIMMRREEFVLDAALAKGLDAPYSCQGGICSSCLAQVTEGEAVMENNSILDDDEVAEGLILTCQAHPVTPVLKIDFDDV